MQEFFDMGGYASFVWSAYGITALIMVVLFVLSWRATRANESKLKTLQATVRDRRKPATAHAAAPDTEIKEAAGEA